MIAATALLLAASIDPDRVAVAPAQPVRVIDIVPEPKRREVEFSVDRADLARLFLDGSGDGGPPNRAQRRAALRRSGRTR